MVTVILSIRNNNLFFKDLIVQINIEILLKLNIYSIVNKIYENFVNNVNIFNENMIILDRELENYFLLYEFYSKEEIYKDIEKNSKYTNNIIKNINFLTAKINNEIIILLNASDRSFYDSINKVIV